MSSDLFSPFESVVRARRSVRVFADEPVPRAAVERALDLALLAPNSSNLQPWEFWWVREPVKKARLVEACLRQAAARTAAELVVVVARTDTWDRNRKAMVAHLDKLGVEGIPVPERVQQYYRVLTRLAYRAWFPWTVVKWLFYHGTALFRPNVREPIGRGDMRLWATKTTALAAQTFMLAMRAQGFDSCPMEGVDGPRIRRLLGLPRGAVRDDGDRDGKSESRRLPEGSAAAAVSRPARMVGEDGRVTAPQQKPWTKTRRRRSENAMASTTAPRPSAPLAEGLPTRATQRLAALVAVVLFWPWSALAAVSVRSAAPFSAHWAHVFHRWWGRGALRLFGMTVDFRGLEHLAPFRTAAPDGKRGAILASNHESLFDIFVLAALPFDFGWIAKVEVSRIPIIGVGMRGLGSFFLQRDGGAKDISTLRVVEDGLRRGTSVVIFPEGTRTRTGQLLPMKKGAFRTAVNANAPIVPIRLRGTFPIAPVGGIPRKRGFPISVHVGEPLYPLPGETAEALLGRYVERLKNL